MGAAMLGGAVMAGRASQRAQYREQDQEARLDQLEQQPAPATAGAYAGAPSAEVAPGPDPAAPPTSGLAAQIKQLADLKESGVLSQEEFEAAKQKLLAS